jgi:hypothetical protein
MMSGQSTKPASDVLEGDPDYLAQQILSFLRLHGLAPASGGEADPRG